MQFCLLNGIKKTDRRLIKKKVLWRLFPMLRYLYWFPELQWQQLELCLEFFLPIDCCHSLAIFWEEERFFSWLQCCLYFHAFCIYQMVSALRKKEKVLWHMVPNTDMKQAALSSLYGIDNAGTGYQNPAPALLIVIILLWYNHKLSTPQTWIEISYIQRDLITVIFYYQISLKPLKTLSLSQVSFPLLFPLYYIVPWVFTNSDKGKNKGKKIL